MSQGHTSADVREWHVGASGLAEAEGSESATPERHRRAALFGDSPGEKFAAGTLGVLMMALATIGMVVSFSTVNAQMQPGFGWKSPLVPVGVDVGILVFALVDVLLTYWEIPLPAVRWFEYLLVGATIYLNAAGHEQAWVRAAHIVLPLLWVVGTGVVRHVIRDRLDLLNGTAHDPIPVMVWLTYPHVALRHKRRMIRWQIKSYKQALLLDAALQSKRARLELTFGKKWRRTAPADEILALRMRERVPAHLLAQALTADAAWDAQIEAATAGIGRGERAEAPALEPSTAPQSLESAPTSVGDVAPSIDGSTFGALVGALAEAVSAQIAAPNTVSAQDGAATSQDGLSSAQPGAPMPAPSPAPVPEPWFEVPAADNGFAAAQAPAEPVFALDGGAAPALFVAPTMNDTQPVYGPQMPAELPVEPVQGQDEETDQTNEEEAEESPEDEPRGRRGRGGRRGLFEGLDALVASGDLRIFDDATRNEAAYQVNENLPSEPPIAKGTVRRYALDYVKVQALYRRLDERATAGDLRVFDDATRDAAVTEVLAEVNAAYNGGTLAPRLVADSVAEYVATRGSRLGADLGAPVTEAAAPWPSSGAGPVVLPRQIAPGGDPVAVDGWASAQ